MILAVSAYFRRSATEYHQITTEALPLRRSPWWVPDGGVESRGRRLAAATGSGFTSCISGSRSLQRGARGRDGKASTFTRWKSSRMVR
jgi:hypothetical protein